MIHIGTSGWVYPHWEGFFYPEKLQDPEKLAFYAETFKTVEINSSFYHLPNEKVFAGWYEKVPEKFIFSVKGSSYITHRKRLLDVSEPVNLFLSHAKLLKDKLGPILWQLPPSFRINLERLQGFLEILPTNKYQFVLEVRDKSWIIKEFFNLLVKYNVALCLADTPDFPYQEELTANFVYLRFHGHEKLYGSKYTPRQLQNWAKKIKKWAKKKDVFVYFDNDAHGYAVENAKELITMIK